MRQKVREPTKRSFITLKASMESGASSVDSRMISESSFGLMPLMAGTSFGAGRYSTTPSSSGCTPLFLKAEPQKIGVKTLSIVPRRMSFLSASLSGSLPSR